MMNYTMTCRLPTNTIVTVELAETGVKSHCDIRTYHQKAVDREVAFHCPTKQYQGKPCGGWYRGQNRVQFEKRKYRWRKLGERPFGNFVTRRMDLNRYGTKLIRQQGLFLNTFAHNLLAYFMELWWHRSFLVLPGVS